MTMSQSNYAAIKVIGSFMSKRTYLRLLPWVKPIRFGNEPQITYFTHQASLRLNRIISICQGGTTGLDVIFKHEITTATKPVKHSRKSGVR